jgi:hypothetical protein
MQHAVDVHLDAQQPTPQANTVTLTPCGLSGHMLLQVVHDDGSLGLSKVFAMPHYRHTGVYQR